MSLIIRAAQFAEYAHENQVRKYTGRPYVEHPMRVAGQVSMLAGTTEEMVAAAWMHDVIEDCPSPIGLLMMTSFPCSVFALVKELTNPSKDHPELSRAERKAMDRNHLACVSDEAKIIKLVDRIDNLREMTNAPADFQLLYSQESRMLADVLRTGEYPFNTLTNRIHRVTAPYMKAAG